MIIECGHCGAPLDVKPGAATTRCLYCGTTSRTKSTKTVAFETPKDWSPPKQWTPPAHVKADSNQVLHLKRAARGIVSAVMTVVTLVGVGVAGLVIFLVQEQSNAASSAAIAGQIAKQLGGGQQAGAQAQVASALEKAREQLEAAQRKVGGLGAPGISLLTTAGAKQALQAYEKAVGGKLNATQLTLHETHSSIEVQSIKNPKYVDHYNYRAGIVSDPQPVRLMGSMKRNLKSHLFDPDKTALTRLDELKTAALGQLAYEQAKITHIIVDRSRGKTVIRVYGRSPRDSGYVAFSDAGKLIRAYR